LKGVYSLPFQRTKCADVGGARAAPCTFFGAAIPLKAVCGEEKMNREVEKVEEESQRRDAG
jgi:hypothetical protein